MQTYYTITLYTVSQIAKDVSRTPCRIRQICRDHDLGVMLEGGTRVLDQGEYNRILDILATDRRRLRGKKILENPQKGVD